MRTERWAFCFGELAHPEACHSLDELTATVLDPDGSGERLEQAVIVYRNGEVSNRWEDGTAGVPADVAELAAEEENLCNPKFGQCADTWADVYVDPTGAFAGWANGVPATRVLDKGRPESAA